MFLSKHIDLLEVMGASSAGLVGLFTITDLILKTVVAGATLWYIIIKIKNEKNKKP